MGGRGAGRGCDDAARDGHGHLRGRLLLVRRIRFRPRPRRAPHRIGLYRRDGRESGLRAGFGRRHWPPRGGGDHLRTWNRKRGGEGKSVSVRVDLGGGRIIKKKKNKK